MPAADLAPPHLVSRPPSSGQSHQAYPESEGTFSTCLRPRPTNQSPGARASTLSTPVLYASVHVHTPDATRIRITPLWHPPARRALLNGAQGGLWLDGREAVRLSESDVKRGALTRIAPPFRESLASVPLWACRTSMRVMRVQIASHTRTPPDDPLAEAPLAAPAPSTANTICDSPTPPRTAYGQ
ncbi:uncharacterized protein B0H18DRAFT_1113705 [Fomitopsis serialis]|uniref:uncharacterized protein n=1 Tax=Fomitopsis serialis TaxID=139415 RepID=UPI00200833BC|nr:uncharacterized protein B0H18DRAFT_1113705 [Neoantrodia serialis]KAH9936292.1 hypothetical protein B0H18DRAFT_1113705 [Neoantrodia serialis]